jgi:hypothetical protein
MDEVWRLAILDKLSLLTPCTSVDVTLKTRLLQDRVITWEFSEELVKNSNGDLAEIAFNHLQLQIH